MPLEMLERVDSIRKDIPRSKFILRMIENGLTIIETPQSHQVPRPRETEAINAPGKERS